jgi:hypothetical protein
VCGPRIDAERLRDRRRVENRELQGINGHGDPLWAVSNIIDVALWSLIEPTLSTGVIWVAAKKNQGYCFSSADARSYWPYFGASGGYAPITVALFEELLEASADFRRDLSDGSLRQLEPNRSMK